jgi:hypothetical protein
MEYFIEGRIKGFDNFKKTTLPLVSTGKDIVEITEKNWKGFKAYSIIIENNFYIISKLMFFIDGMRVNAKGYIQFSIPFKKELFLEEKEGEKVIDILDKLIEAFEDNYVDNEYVVSNQINSTTEFDQIVNQNPIKTKTGTIPIKAIPSGNEKIGKIYCTREEIAKLFESPIWEEFYPYQQVFLLSNDLKNENCFENLELIDFDLTFSTFQFVEHDKLEIIPRKNRYSLNDSVSIEVKESLKGAYRISNSEGTSSKPLSEYFQEGKINQLEHYSVSIPADAFKIEKNKKAIAINLTNKEELALWVPNTNHSKIIREGVNTVEFEGEEIISQWNLRDTKNLKVPFRPFTPLHQNSAVEIEYHPIKETVTFSIKDKNHVSLNIIDQRNNYSQNAENITIGREKKLNLHISAKSKKPIEKQFYFDGIKLKELSQGNPEEIITNNIVWIELESKFGFKFYFSALFVAIIIGFGFFYRSEIGAWIIPPPPPVEPNKNIFSIRIDSTNIKQIYLKADTMVYWFRNSELLESGQNTNILVSNNGEYYASKTKKGTDTSNHISISINSIKPTPTPTPNNDTSTTENNALNANASSTVSANTANTSANNNKVNEFWTYFNNNETKTPMQVKRWIETNGDDNLIKKAKSFLDSCNLNKKWKITFDVTLTSSINRNFNNLKNNLENK